MSQPYCYRPRYIYSGVSVLVYRTKPIAIKITPIIKRKMICMRTDSCEYVMKGFTGTLAFFGVVFSKKKRMKQAMKEANPSAIA